MGTERDRLVKTLIASKVPLDIPPDAIVIIEGVRTPVTKANRGKLKDFRADQLLSVVLKVIPPTYLELNIADLSMRGPLVFNIQ